MALAGRSKMAWGCWLALTLAAACGGDAFHIDHESTGGSSGTASGGNAGSSTTAGKGSTGGSSHAGAGGAPLPIGGSSTIDAGAPPTEAGESSGGDPPVQPPISTSGLVYWFRADAGVTETSGRISKWSDQSGNAQDAAQQLSTQRPKLTRTNLLPLPVVEFDGESVLELPSIDAPLDGGLTFFVIAGRSDDSGCSAFLELDTGKDETDVHFGHSGVPVHFEVDDAWYDTEVDVFPVGAMRQVTVEQSADAQSTKGAKVEVYANGAFIGSKEIAFPVRAERTRNFIGQSQYESCTRLVGGIGELVLYARALPMAERVAVEKYLKNKWQLPD
jgi:hypothetical protein